MPIPSWLSSTTHFLRTLNRNERRRRLKRQSLTTLDSLEPRVLLAATALNTIPAVRLPGAGDTADVELEAYFDDPGISGSTVRVTTGLGSFYVETFDEITPMTTNNFLDLIAAGRYDDMFFHRSATGFVLQGGGFTFPEGQSTTASVVHNGTIENEFDNWFDPELGGLSEGDPVNVRGTIAMAKLGGDPNSATSQWFVSVEDNQHILDPQNGGFTAFGHVLFDGMDLVDQLMALEVADAGGAFSDLPVINLDPNADSIERYNLVLTTTTIVDELSYATTASDLVTAEVVDGMVQFTATELAADYEGTVKVTVTATDLQGNEVSSIVSVVLGGTTITSSSTPESGTSPITWNENVNAVSYDLWVNKLDDRSPNVNEVPEIIREDEIAGTSYTPEEALPDGRYNAWVRVRGADGPGAWSPAFRFSIGLEKPATVTAITVAPSSENELDVTLQWDAVEDATHYDLWVNEVGGETLVQETWLAERSYQPSFLLETGKTYRVWVRGRNAVYVGDWSAATRFIGGTEIPQRVNITGPTDSAIIVDDRRPVFAWSADANATEYEVWVAVGGSSEPLIRTTVTGTTFQPAEDLAEGFVRVWVRAKNGNGSTSWSRPITVGVSSTVTSVVVTGPTGDVISARPDITWNDGVVGANYDLWVNQVGGQSQIIFETGLTASTFSPAADLAEGQYVAWVRQVSPDGGAFAWSSGFRFTVGTNTVPAQPTLTVDTNSGTPRFSWAAVENAANYELWVSLDGQSVVNETEIAGLEFTATELQASGTYRAWLRAFSSTGAEGAWSAVVIFDV